MSYFEEFKKLHKEGKELKEITRKLYLENLPSADQDDIIKIKTKIMEIFEVPYKDIVLIGSGQLGFNRDSKEVEPNDYDFIIVNSHMYIKILEEIVEQGEFVFGSSNSKETNFIASEKIGKLHFLFTPKYELDPKIMEKLNHNSSRVKGIMNKMKQDLDIKKSISICIFLSEKLLILGLEKYMKENYIPMLLTELKAETSLKPFKTTKGVKEVTKFK